MLLQLKMKRAKSTEIVLGRQPTGLRGFFSFYSLRIVLRHNLNESLQATRFLGRLNLQNFSSLTQDRSIITGNGLLVQT